MNVRSRRAGQTQALLFNVLETKDCKPFVNRARVVGLKRGPDSCQEIHLQPIGNQAALDDPKLPRYLFIGDSISGTTTVACGHSLAGSKLQPNTRPPIADQPKGRSSILEWLGAYRQPGRHWGVISFNHGHWDSKNDKAAIRRTSKRSSPNSKDPSQADLGDHLSRAQRISARRRLDQRRQVSGPDGRGNGEISQPLGPRGHEETSRDLHLRSMAVRQGQQGWHLQGILGRKGRSFQWRRPTDWESFWAGITFSW